MAEPENQPLSEDEPAQPLRSRRAYLIQGLVALLVLVITVFIARALLQPSPTMGPKPMPEREARLVEVVAVAPQQYQPTITGWGTLIPSRELVLQAQVGGAVQAVSPRLDPGLTVGAGDELVQLDVTAYAAAVAEAESILAEAEANLALEQGQQSIAEREFELLNDGSGGWGQAPGSDIQRDLVLRQPQLRIAQSAVESARARLEQARQELEYATVKAPFDALVTSRAITLGSQVSSSTELARLVGIGTWWIEALVSADQLKWLQTDLAGEPAHVLLRQPGVWDPGQTRQGTVLRTLPKLEDQGNLARVLVAVQDPLGRQPDTQAAAKPTPRLLLGAFLRADIQGDRLDDVFVLEPRWLRENDSVWVMDADQSLEVRQVEVLYRDEQAVVISSGLKAGDKVVTSRLSTPAEHMPLRTEALTDSADQGTGGPAGQADTERLPQDNAGGAKHG